MFTSFLSKDIFLFFLRNRRSTEHKDRPAVGRREHGNERIASDQAWALKRADEGKSIDLTADDCDFNGYIPKVLKFTATVTLRDGMGEAAGIAAAVFQY